MSFGPPPPPPGSGPPPPPGSAPPPHQPPHQPGQPYPPGQSPRPRRTLRTVLIVLAVVGVLCCGGLVTGGVFVFRAVDGAAEPARDATRAFLDDLRDQDYDAAYAQLCIPTRMAISREVFEETERYRSELTDYRLTGVSVANNNGLASGIVSVRVTRADGSSSNHQIPLLKEGDDWRVCGQPY